MTKVSTCWITNLQFVSQSTKLMLGSSDIKGYVQRLDVSLK